jgi:hypothetical protein
VPGKVVNCLFVLKVILVDVLLIIVVLLSALSLRFREVRCVPLNLIMCVIVVVVIRGVVAFTV